MNASEFKARSFGHLGKSRLRQALGASEDRGGLKMVERYESHESHNIPILVLAVHASVSKAAQIFLGRSFLVQVGSARPTHFDKFWRQSCTHTMSGWPDREGGQSTVRAAFHVLRFISLPTCSGLARERHGYNHAAASINVS